MKFDLRVKHGRARGRRTLEYAAVATVLIGLTVALQIAAGAHTASFGFDADSHYVSGLMVHDYLAAIPGRSPLAFLQDFHSHYPLIGIGHWGPAYYLIEAAWMLLFSTGRWSVLTLSAAVTTITATMLYILAARRYGRPCGFVAAVLFACCPIVQEASDAVMLDGIIALLCLAATLVYARYLQDGRMRDAALFGLLASAALLVKGNGGCLALLPPFALLLGGRLHLLRRVSFWLPVPIVSLLSGPWYLATYGQISQGFRYHWGVDYAALATGTNLHFLLGSVGPAALVLAVVGFVVVATRRAGEDEGLITAAALLAAVWVFQSVVPSGLEDRYLLALLPPLFLLAILPVYMACRRISPAVAVPGVVAACAILLAACALPFLTAPSLPPQFALDDIARQVWAERPEANPSVLIATAREGAMVAELAMADPHRPSLFAIRGSRLLGRGGYNQQDYLPRFSTAAEVMAAIDAYAIPLVLLRNGQGAHEWEHLRQLDEARMLFPDRWELLARGEDVSLFRVRGNDARRPDQAKILELSAPAALRAGVHTAPAT